MGELKKDFNDGKISQEKYYSLLNSYEDKLKTIDATLRVRKMKRLTEDDDFNHKADKKGSKKGNIVDNYIVKGGKNGKHLNEPKSSRKYIIIVILFIIIAFIAGATSGFFNYSQQNNTQFVNSLQIDENAFPPSIENKSYTPAIKTSDYSSTTYTTESYGDSDYNDDQNEFQCDNYT
ncbi:MAG: hypothetical protein LBT10_04070 [Methanobrevibacter sp.]|jgi:hypothetical protein|nr:hypothetical protein [Methanobrevibacter sp.]